MATIVTVAIAAPVIRAPSERLFGMEVVGRHHDPFTVMQHFERPITVGMYSQPVTDMTGAVLARVSGPVAAYNWLVLLSFPLAAAASYLLARHLTLSPAASAFAALAFAFSPFHLAHAAYHPHIAQIQWIPLYLLALWRCLDAATPVAVAFLGVATLAVTLSNFYGGLIAAVITPIAVAAYWLFMRPILRRPTQALSVTVISLVLIAACGLTYASYVANAVMANREAFAFPRADLFLYSAKWWSYLVPPAAHPMFGQAAQRIWSAAGVRDGLLEQQVSLGLGIVALGAVAVGRWIWLVRNRQSSCGTRVPVLVIVAATALACSLAPERSIGSTIVTAPSALVYAVAPMFRAYARFGVVVQLMAALLAGIGVDFLRRAGTRRAQMACVALMAVVVGEYAVRPSSLWRDVLPTTAHRWIAQQPGDMRALDCVSLNRKSQSVQWLTANRVLLAAGSPADCTEPNFPQKLAAGGYTHLLVRRNTSEGRWFERQATVEGLRVAAALDDGQVFAVTAATPTIYTAAMTGFFRREHSVTRTWRWAAQDAAWTIVNTGVRPIVATLAVELWAYQRARSMDLLLDGNHVQTIVVEPSRRVFEVGPLTVGPGERVLTFRSADTPTVADEVARNGNRRHLSFAVGSWRWTVQNGQR
jgi:hypothetical protein